MPGRPRTARTAGSKVTFAATILMAAAACQPQPAEPSPQPTALPSVVTFPPPTTAPSATAGSTPVPSYLPITGRIAFVRNTADTVPQTDIWVVDAQGGAASPLTSDPENEASPVWLLDGSRLVFAVFDYAKNPYYGRLVSTLPDGSDRQDLAPVANYGDGLASPDGRYVAWGGGGEIDDHDGITLLDRATGEASRLTTDGDAEPIWSPDSRHLLTREYLLGGVAVVDVPSGHITRFRKAGVDGLVGWSADGQTIVFGNVGNVDGPLWRAPASGGDIDPYTRGLDLARPGWSSPDGMWTIDDALQVQASRTDDWRPLAPGLRMVSGSPTWSPDSRAIAVACQDPVNDTVSAICVVGIDGRDPIEVTNGALDSSPAWDPAR